LKGVNRIIVTFLKILKKVTRRAYIL
jgi:hypothetical protein